MRSRRDPQRRSRYNLLHNFVPSEVFDHRITCLHGVENAIRLRPVQQCPQFHEMMTAASRVETVERDYVSLIALQRASI